MSKLTINVSTPNDGLGDPLRDAMVSVNHNFTELYNQSVNSTGTFTFTGVHNHNANLSLNAQFIANSSEGSPGYVLTSSGYDSNVYWQDITNISKTGTITSITLSNGLTDYGTAITSTGTVSVRAGSGIVSNSTGTHVNPTYIATLAANSAMYLNGQNSLYYTNATNLTLGKLPYDRLGVNVVNTTAEFTRLGNTIFNANISIGAGVAIIDSTGAQGSQGQVLTSNGTSNVYWAAVQGVNGGTVTSVGIGNGLTSATNAIVATGTVSVLAGNGIISNSSGVHVFANSIGGLVANSTGSHILVGSGLLTNSSGAHVRAGNGIISNTLGTHVFANATGGLIANSTGAFVLAANGIITTADGTNVKAGTGIVSNSSGVNVDANYIATIAANSASYLGTLSATNYVSTSGPSYTVQGNLYFTATNNYFGTAMYVGANVYANSTVVFVGNSSANAFIAKDGFYINGTKFSGAGGGYYKGNGGTVGNQTNINNIFRINANSITQNITIAAGENAQATGPVVIAPGYILTIQTGGRAVII